jgi:hypothetical protein
MELQLTRYTKTGDIGLDWMDGRPAVERLFKSEQEARACAAKHFPYAPVVRTRDWQSR